MGPVALLDTDRDGNVVLSVHVQPRAKRPGVAGRHGDALKLRVGAPPTGGRANQAAIELLADVLGVPAATITLVSGASSRQKRFRLAGADAAAIADRLSVLVGPA
jgi:uncharacterized protein